MRDLILQLSKSSIYSTKPAIGINPADYVKATSAMSNQHKAFCDGILKAASSKVTRLQRDATVRILEAQTKRNKAITAASEAAEVAQSMGGLNESTLQ
ncbi:hypothetical protein [Klebsiella pneumoniae]|uniref:hypothetical protein n=1 Tax=Klebsiella pneumoniae TaxID=573 RepID=UPI00214B8E2A|nr:hypothetical protein [Klebsiella pneumoniae]